jgi:hypothetical protein
LIQTDQLLDQNAHSDDFSEVLAALEAARAVGSNAYLKQRMAKVMDQVERILQNGPALITLKTSLEDKQTSMAGGDVA